MTLLETLVVVAILALVGAIGWPEMRGRGAGAVLRADTGALVADLKRARAAARHLDRPVTFAADADGRGWRWDGGAFRLEAPLRLAADPVVFFPDGSATGRTLTLGGGPNLVSVRVDRATGQLAIGGR